MKVNSSKLVVLMNQYYSGNYSRFARDLGVDASHLHRYINTGIGGGKKIVGAVIKFCMLKQLDFNEYIDF